MRLLHLSSGKDFGGGERHVLELTTTLATRGHTLHLAVRPHSQLRIELTRFPHLHIHSFGFRNALDLLTVKGLCRLMTDQQIEVIHAHYGRDYTLAALAVRWLRRNNARLPAFFFTRHHYLPLSTNPAYRWLLSAADAAIAVSSSVQTTVCQSLNWPVEHVRVIPNWVDTAQFQPSNDQSQARRQFGFPQAARLIGVINQIAPEKGQAELIEAVARLANQFPDLHLVLAGKEHGGDRFIHALKEMVTRLGLTQRVHWPGFVTDVPQLLAALDVVAIPSWNEAFSLSALEALAAGVPLVASQVGGLCDILTQNQTALLVPPRNVEALALAIQQLLESVELRNRLQKAGLERVHTFFSREAIVTQVEQLYTDTLRK